MPKGTAPQTMGSGMYEMKVYLVSGAIHKVPGPFNFNISESGVLTCERHNGSPICGFGVGQWVWYEISYWDEE